MVLSYALRITCLIGVSMGLLQTVLELLLWLAAPALLRALRSLPLRAQERSLYLVQIVPFSLALSYTAFCCVPRYLANETNFLPERVGWLPLILASSCALWWGIRLFSGARMLAGTAAFRRHIRGASANRREPLPVVAVEGPAPRVALVGLRHPFILVSRSLLQSGGLDPLALEVVLDHERAHATQHDNWKLLSLRCLPRLGLKLPSGTTWNQLWRNAAERAADQDAVQGSRSRAFLLAETLVAFARSRHTAPAPIVCTDFACDETELASRVEHLLRSQPARPTSASHKLALALGLVLLAVLVTAADLAPLLGDLPEHLLHLG